MGSRQAEQLSSRSQQRVVATVEESVLKTEMTGLESQEEDTPKRILFFKPMRWLGQIRTHRRDESWSPSLWQTFFSVSQLLNDVTADKVRKYRADYNKRPPSVVSFMSAIASTSGRLHSEFVRLLFLQAHRETDRFFAASGVLSSQSDCGLYHYHRAAVSTQLKSKVGLALAKAAALRITLNLDGAPIISRTHTHPSHSQTSRLLTSSLSLGVPVPRATQCMRDA